MSAIFRNKKTGKLYAVLGDGVDCTNTRTGLPVVIDRALEGDAQLLVQDIAEFDLTFETMTPDDPLAGQIMRATAEVATWPESVRAATTVMVG